MAGLIRGIWTCAQRAAGWARARRDPGGAWSAIDQATKQATMRSLERGESVNVFFGLDLTNTRNRGAAFGALEGRGEVVAR